MSKLPVNCLHFNTSSFCVSLMSSRLYECHKDEVYMATLSIGDIRLKAMVFVLVTLFSLLKNISL